MELLKSIFSVIDFHLDAPNKILTINYGNSQIQLSLTETGQVKVDSNLLLAVPETKYSQITKQQ